MQRRIFLCLPLAPLLALAVPPGKGNGKGKGKAKGHHKGDDYDEGETVPSHIRFRDQESRLIREYYYGGGRGLPPGLAKRGGDLPPGLEKQLRRKGTLPPGLQKKLTPFPADLERRLPPVYPGYRRALLGNRAVLIDDRTNTVLDAIDLVDRVRGR